MIILEEIQRVLPHRHPMLLVDQVVEHGPPDSLAAIKAVTINEPWYAGVGGRLESSYEYPGTLLVESWCQAAALLALTDRPGVGGVTPLIGRLSDIDFPAPVLPGDVVKNRVRLVDAGAGAAVLTGDAVVAHETVLTVGSVIIAFRDTPGSATGEGGAR